MLAASHGEPIVRMYRADPTPSTGHGDAEDDHLEQSPTEGLSS